MDKEQDRRVRQGFEAHMVELPKPASLMRTHISTPIRSIMSISSEEGHVLARQDVLIRMEDDADDYDSDMDVREHQLKKSTNRLARTSYCSSIVPLTPKIPQQYISSSSAESCLSRGSSAVTSLSRPIGYDPEWIDATEDDGNYDSDYN
ncbi:hypothetical protein EC957_004769 [Mortierella hygrophila]|uniref:Uncharacterized protein n=1 Tax=Mortierella hygrophila TaxID=979708 RepID=A0A9P6FDZ9_9FUNG|nr:hypothetical protein EC957_004769 [Mortierella hygrophila]